MNARTVKMLIVFVIATGLPQARGFDLWDAWQAARRHAPQYRAARHRRNAAHESERQAQAQLLPQLRAGASYSNQPQSGYDKYQTHGWNLEFSQTLFDKSKWANYQAGKLGTQVSDSDFHNRDAALLMEVAKAYLDILTLKDKLTAVTAEKTAYQTQIARARAMFRSGAATVIDTYEAQSGYDSAVAKALDLDTQLLTARNTLNNATGLDPRALEPMRQQNLPDWLAKTSERQWLKQALATNPELETQRLKLEKSQKQLSAYKGRRWPSVTVNAGYQDMRNDIRYTSGADFHSRGRGAYVGLRFDLSLYSGGENESRIRQAEEQMRENRELLEQMRREVTLRVKQAYAQMRGKQAQMRAQRRLLATNEAKLASTRLGRRVGVRSTLDEIKAQQDKASAEEQLAEARYGYVEAYLRLLEACGVLNQARGRDAVLSLFELTTSQVQPAHRKKPEAKRALHPLEALNGEHGHINYAVDLDLNLIPIS